jgi:putative ABC transport system permease protein
LEGRRSYGALAEGGGVYIPDGFYEIGDVLSVVVGGRAVDLPVVGVADTLPGGNYNPGTAVAAIETVRAIAEDEGYTGLEVELVPGTDAQDVARSIEAIAGNRNDVFAFDMTTVEESGEQIGLQMSILLYGLVAVVSLIGAVNIINTITTNIILRVREFGTLRAVGMSARQMRGMVRIEAVLYGFWAVLGGGAIGVALTRMIFNNVTQVQAIAWQFPWVSVTVSTVAAVGLSLASAAIPMRRITDMSIVESIRTVA